MFILTDLFTYPNKYLLNAVEKIYRTCIYKIPNLKNEMEIEHICKRRKIFFIEYS